MANSHTGILGRLEVPAARTPGSLGINDAADPNTRMCMMGDTPGPLGTGEDFATPASPVLSCAAADIPLLVFDLEKVARFVRTVALAKAQQSYTRIKWEEYNESTVINVIYALMPWKGKPGTAVVVQGQPVQVYAKADVDSAHLLGVFIARAAAGPGPAVQFLEAQERIRTQALESVKDVMRDAAKIDKEVEATAADGVKWLSAYKCGADLIVTGLGLVLEGPLAIAIGLLYSPVKDWAKGKDASAVALTGVTEASKKLAEAGAKAGQNAAVPKALQGMDRWVAEEAILEKMDLIEKYERELVGKGPGKQARLNTRIRLRMSEVEALTKAASPARRAISKGFRSVKFVFAAKDAYDSIKELIETWPDADK